MRDVGDSTLSLHRAVAARAGLAIDGFLVDHENGDGLDCRRSNLRVTTGTQNQVNYRHKARGCSSQYKRVCWNTRKRQWEAQIQRPKTSGDVRRGARMRVGYFRCEVEAALFADIIARHFHGVHASANFPDVLASLPALHQITDEQLMAALELARKL